MALTTHQVTFAGTIGGPIAIAAGDGSGATGYILSGNLLSNAKPALVQVENGGGAPIAVQGNIDLSQAIIGCSTPDYGPYIEISARSHSNGGAISTRGGVVVENPASAGSLILDGNNGSFSFG
jgi:hypothetical protein